MGDLFASFNFDELPNAVNMPTYQRLCAFLRDNMKRADLVPPAMSVREVIEAIKKFNTSSTLCWHVARGASGGVSATQVGLGDFDSTQRVFAHCAKAVFTKVETTVAELERLPVPCDPKSTVAARMAALPLADGATAAPGSVGVVQDLGKWLHSQQLDEFEPVLRNLGAVDAHDVRAGFATGAITRELLEAEGFLLLRIIRLQRKASEVSRLKKRGVRQ